MMDVVSPTSVAAPCKLDDTAIERIMFVGLIFNFRQIASPTGATISTVATLSINALIKPANRDIKIVTHITFLDFSRSRSAKRFGIWESIKYCTMIIVPEIIMRTFQLTVAGKSDNGSIPTAKNTMAVASAYSGLYFGFSIIRTYIKTNKIKARVFKVRTPLFSYYQLTITSIYVSICSIFENGAIFILSSVYIAKGSPLDESAGLPKKKGKTDLFVVAVIIDEAAVGDDLTFGIGEGLDLFGFAFGDDLGAVYKIHAAVIELDHDELLL